MTEITSQNMPYFNSYSMKTKQESSIYLFAFQIQCDQEEKKLKKIKLTNSIMRLNEFSLLILGSCLILILAVSIWDKTTLTLRAFEACFDPTV